MRAKTGERERERQIDRQRERQRETDRQTERETERDRQTDRDRHTETDQIETDRDRPDRDRPETDQTETDRDRPDRDRPDRDRQRQTRQRQTETDQTEIDTQTIQRQTDRQSHGSTTSTPKLTRISSLFRPSAPARAFQSFPERGISGLSLCTSRLITSGGTNFQGITSSSAGSSVESSDGGSLCPPAAAPPGPTLARVCSSCWWLFRRSLDKLVLVSMLLVLSSGSVFLNTPMAAAICVSRAPPASACAQCQLKIKRKTTTQNNVTRELSICP